MARYRAFFVTLGSVPEGAADWRAAFAGLVTLRYIDAWVESGFSGSSLDAEREAVESAIRGVPDDMPERLLLEQLVQSCRREPHRDLTVVAPLLMAYGRSLQQRSTWALAVAVYARVKGAWLPGAGTRHDALLGGAAALRSGACHRKLGDAKAAEAEYRAALSIARKWDDEHLQLRARTSLADLDADRGNLPSADQQLSKVIADAVSERMRDVRGMAWHDRAQIAHRRGRVADAIDYAYEAWSATDEPVARERVLNDLAAIALAAGYRETARDANMVLLATAREPYIRWIATINLMEIATLDRREVEFTRLRRTLAGVALGPALQAEYVYYGALGDLAFQRRSQAIEGLRRVVEVAEERQLGEVLFRAEAALERACDETYQPRPEPSVVTPERLSHVSAALSNARTLATIAD